MRKEDAKEMLSAIDASDLADQIDELRNEQNDDTYFFWTSANKLLDWMAEQLADEED